MIVAEGSLSLNAHRQFTAGRSVLGGLKFADTPLSITILLDEHG